MDLDTSTLTVACNVRTSLFLEPVDAKVETLREADRAGDIAGLVLRTWPNRVRVDEDSPYQETIDLYHRYDRWAERHDRSIEPPFSVHTTSSMASDQEWEVLVTPIMCLGVYHDRQLLGVFPHSDGDTTHSATDAIGALRSGELPPPLASIEAPIDTGPDTDGKPSGPPTCPRCESALVNVQGLLSCAECGRTLVEEPRPVPQR